MPNMTPSSKGAVAEAKITAAAVEMDLCVLRPFNEGRRYDLVIDLVPQLLRVQCKWACRREGVLTARISTSRLTPRGYLRTTYSPHEIDAFAIYAPSEDRCFLVPIEVATGMSYIHLRLTPSKNNQRNGVRWAKDFDFERRVRALMTHDPGDIPPLRVAQAPSKIQEDLGL